MKIKKIIITIIIFVVCMGIAQSIRFSVERNTLQDFELSEEGNCLQYVNECDVGNKVIVWEQNGLLTFPFIFGERLYMYDVENKEKALLAHTFLPFTEIGEDVVVTNDAVYYNEPFWKEVVGDFYQINGKDEKIKIDTYDTQRDLYLGYSVYKNKIYYEKVDTFSEEYKKSETDLCSDIYVTDLETGKERLFLEGNIGYFRIIKGKMYCYDWNEKKIFIVDIETGSIEEIPYECEIIEYIVRSDEDKLYILDCVLEDDKYVNRIVEYDIANRKVTWNVPVVPKSFNIKMHYNDGEIYFLTEDYSICKIDPVEKSRN